MDVNMQQKLQTTRAELHAVRIQLESAKQQKQRIELSGSQMSAEATEGQVWQGVGRVFIKMSIDEHKKESQAELKELDEQVSSLQKKEVYYTTTLEKMLQALNVEKDA